MMVIINGAPHDVSSDTTIADIVAMITGSVETGGIAVARNGDVILRSVWRDTPLASDDRVEVLHAVQGG